MKKTSLHRAKGSTLVEVVVAILIFAIAALALVPLLRTIRASGMRGSFELQGLGLVEGCENALLADLALGESNSPLFKAMPLDFTKRWVTASGSTSTPWTLSTSAAYDSISAPALSDYQMETTIQYFDDPADGLGSADVDEDPHDALKIRARLVPVQSGVVNLYPTVWLETYWYRNP